MSSIKAMLKSLLLQELFSKHKCDSQSLSSEKHGEAQEPSTCSESIKTDKLSRNH